MDPLVFISFIASFQLVQTGCGSLTPDAYWKEVFPNMPMPDAIRTLLPSEELSELGNAYNPTSYNHLTHTWFQVEPMLALRPYWRVWSDIEHDHDHPKPVFAHGQTNRRSSNAANIFFLVKDLKPGNRMNRTMMNPEQGDRIGLKFLPHEEAQAVPFSTSNLTGIFKLFSIKDDSYEAFVVRQTLHDCETPPIKGEAKYCATSLANMIDFAISQLGTSNIHLLTSSDIREEGKGQAKGFILRIDGVEMKSFKTVTCHSMVYPYAVFYCHKLPDTRSYMVSLVGADGVRLNATALCHCDTSNWNPGHPSFQMLGVKPGTVPICHFLLQGFAWVAN